MNRVFPLCAVAAVAGLALLMLQAVPVKGDHEDGHLYDWGAGILALQQGLIGGTSIPTCTTEFPASTAAAITRWNNSLGFTVFQSSQSCGSGVSVQTTDFAERCNPNSHACTLPTNLSGDPNYSINNPTYVFMNPSLFGSEGTWPDGDTHTSRDVSHEFGHVLGHADYSGCPTGVQPTPTPTLLDTTENCWWESPQPLDISNYSAAYFADAVTNLQGSSGAPNTVSPTWNPSNVHNEDYYGIFRDGSLVGTAAKNASGWSSSSEPAGQHQYVVASHTNAYCGTYGGFCGSAGPVTVNVQAPTGPARPINVRWSTASRTNSILQWTDNSTNEDTFEIWRCGGSSAQYTVATTTRTGTGSTYSYTVTIPSNTNSCYTVRAVNAGGASSVAPGAPFLNTTRGNCGSAIPCGHSHSNRRIELLASKTSETSSTVRYIVRNKGSATAYNVDLWDNIFGVHLDGPWNLSAGGDSGWDSHSVTSTRQVLVFWCTSSSCSDQHWDGVSY